MRQQQARSVQLPILAGPEVRAGDLLDLIAQQILPRLSLRQHASTLNQTRFQLSPVSEGRFVSRARLGEPAELVEQVQLHSCFEQGLVVVLTVNVHQEAAQGLEDAERGRPAVDMNAVPPYA